MVDLTALQPFVIGFLVVAGLATVVSVAVLAHVAVDLRRARPTSPVVSITGRSAATAVAGRAA